ncbi:TRAM domain-containing protein, partial [bacterium]|nr:TRAM domain-containing protein [bacterium]
MLIELKIQDISSDGRGVARTPEGRVVMVDQTLPGDIAEVSLDLEAKGSVLSGTLTRMIESSVNRIDHPCEFACKGCISSPLGSLKYDAQLKWKESHLRETLKRISKRTLPEISTIN